jgi:glycosyltransferase involved in cell wall biosynthesis
MTVGGTSPLVSFVVPCYKHGHFLAECVESILGQTYPNLEVLIMDDCSPDDTPAIARSIADPRVRHVRNERNLGHLANYNKGIGLATGKYVWLINVDDYLRRPYVLERFVATLERHPSAAYVICPAVRVLGCQEAEPFGSHGPADVVFSGPQFLERLARGNCVPTPAAMVRKASYERRGMFPLDLPHSGDWYQWCNHALYGGVAYLAEPMVCYRIHDQNMTKEYLERPAALLSNIMSVRWRIKDMAEQAGLTDVARAAVDAMGDDYAFRIRERLAEGSTLGITFEEFESSLDAHVPDAQERLTIKARAYTVLGDYYYRDREVDLARQFYGRALKERPGDLRTRMKSALLAAGPIGRTFRAAVTRQLVVS